MIFKYDCSKGEMDSCQSERRHQMHRIMFKRIDNWTTRTLVTEIFKNVRWRRAKTPIFEAMERKKHPIISEEHFLQMTESSTVLRNYLLLAEVRLNNQTDGEISAF